MKIKTVESFNYLGSIIQRNGTSDLHIERRIAEIKKLLIYLIQSSGIKTLLKN